MKKRSFRAFALTLAVMFALGTVTALANSDEVAVKIHDISAGTTVTVKTYNRTQLGQLEPIGFHHYSSKTGGSNPTYREFTAEGPTIYRILSESGINVSNVINVVVDSNDGYTKTIAKSYLLDNNLKYFNSSGTEIESAPAILATKAARGYKTNADQLSDSNTLRLFFGQQNHNDHIMNKFVKNTAVITVEVP